MYVSMMVPECDMNDMKYSPAVEGAGILAQGATGRYCVVLYAGPEYLKENNITPMTYEDAVSKVESKPGAWVDF